MFQELSATDMEWKWMDRRENGTTKFRIYIEDILSMERLPLTNQNYVT